MTDPSRFSRGGDSSDGSRFFCVVADPFIWQGGWVLVVACDGNPSESIPPVVPDSELLLSPSGGALICHN